MLSPPAGEIGGKNSRADARLFSQFLIPSRFQAFNTCQNNHIGTNGRTLHDLFIEVEVDSKVE